MNKYPLIGGSILAMVLLVLASLSNVIGYESVRTNTVNDSPLFRTRTQKATNQQLLILTSQYLGKGKEIRISLPDRDKRTETINMILHCIKRMDDTSLRRLAFLIYHHLPQDNKIKKFDHTFDTEKIFQGLKKIGDTSNIDGNTIKKSKDSKIRSNVCSLDCTMEFYDPKCWPFLIIYWIIIIFDMLIFIPLEIILQLLTLAC